MIAGFVKSVEPMDLLDMQHMQKALRVYEHFYQGTGVGRATGCM